MSTARKKMTIFERKAYSNKIQFSIVMQRHKKKYNRDHIASLSIKVRTNYSV